MVGGCHSQTGLGFGAVLLCVQLACTVLRGGVGAVMCVVWGGGDVNMQASKQAAAATVAQLKRSIGIRYVCASA
jgi:hypothetical protein